MNPAELPLRDIHLPPAVSWWPPALGWWLLLALALVLGGAVLWLRWRARQPVPLRRAALTELAAIESRWQQSQDPRELVYALSALLRRIAVSLHPRARTASMTGTAWLAFLDEASGSREFSQGAGQVFGQSLYQRRLEVDAAAVLAACRRWVERATARGRRA